VALGQVGVLLDAPKLIDNETAAAVRHCEPSISSPTRPSCISRSCGALRSLRDPTPPRSPRDRRRISYSALRSRKDLLGRLAGPVLDRRAALAVLGFRKAPVFAALKPVIGRFGTHADRLRALTGLPDGDDLRVESASTPQARGRFAENSSAEKRLLTGAVLPIRVPCPRPPKRDGLAGA
jgi:hypothetical protein